MSCTASFHRLVLGILAGLLLVACRPEAAEQALRPVPLPNLEGLSEAAQQQIKLQHARTEAGARQGASASPGSDYGTLGQLLYTYDFLEAAEPALLNAQDLQPEDDRWSYYLGMLYRQQGAFAEAAAQFEQVLARDPKDVLARLRLADALLEVGQAEAARDHLASVVRDQPGNAFAHFLLGQMAYEAGAYQEAVSHYEAALRLQPSASQVHSPLGMAYRNLGDEERSRYHLARRGQALVQLNDPRVRELEAFKQTSGATALNRGEALLNAGQYAEAVPLLEQAVAQDPTNPSAFLNLGVARARAGNTAGAIQAFEDALRLDPDDSKASYNLGAIYLADGQKDRAEQLFRAAIASDPRHRSAFIELAELLRRTGRCGEAVPFFVQALEITPGDVAARQHLALCHLRLGREAAARTLLEDGLAANPGHLGFLDALARVLAASTDDAVRDGARALHLAEEVYAIQQRTEFLETLAMAHAELGHFDEAITWQTRAIEAAEPLNHTAYLDHLRRNLRRYEAGTPCRTPWPPFMYES